MHIFTDFPVWRLLFSAHTRNELWDFPSNLACVAGIVYKKWSLPTSLPAVLLLSPWVPFSVPALASNSSAILHRTSKVRFFLAWFVVQDVWIHHGQVEQMKEKFLPPLYCLPWKWIIGQNQVWSFNTRFVLVVIQHNRWSYFAMCLLDDGASTSTSSWAVVRKWTSRTSFHLMAKRWSRLHVIFSPFFNFAENAS